jgi:hypothetical protein
LRAATFHCTFCAAARRTLFLAGWVLTSILLAGATTGSLRIFTTRHCLKWSNIWMSRIWLFLHHDYLFVVQISLNIYECKRFMIIYWSS